MYFAHYFLYVLKACLSWLEEGGSLLEEMEREARSAPLQYRAEMLASTRSYKSRYNTANQCSVTVFTAPLQYRPEMLASTRSYKSRYTLPTEKKARNVD
jgi:hypothetical protein